MELPSILWGDETIEMSGGEVGLNLWIMAVYTDLGVVW